MPRKKTPKPPEQKQGSIADVKTAPAPTKKPAASVRAAPLQVDAVDVPAKPGQGQKKVPHPRDRVIGMNIRTRRMILDMSQQRLADQLGLTFQQVQKYEKGTNRVAGSRLVQIAKALQSKVSDLIGEDPDGAPGEFLVRPDALVAMGATRTGLELAKAFVLIEDPRLQRRVKDHVVMISELASSGGVILSEETRE